jgi:uncharacterized membrane protein
MKWVSFLCTLLALPLLAYGAVAPNTIGGLNFLASVLALLLSGLGVLLGAVLMVRERASRRSQLPVVMLSVAAVGVAVVVLLTREFAAGYGH